MIKIEHVKWITIVIGLSLTANDIYRGDMSITWAHWAFIAFLFGALELFVRFELGVSQELAASLQKSILECNSDYDELHDRHLAHKQRAEEEVTRLRESVDSKQKWIDDLEDTIKSVRRTTEGSGKF